MLLKQKVAEVIPDENSQGLSLREICSKIPGSSESDVEAILNGLFKDSKIEVRSCGGGPERYRFARTVNSKNCLS